MRYKIKTQKNGSQYPFLDEAHKPLISHNGLLKHLYKVSKQLGIERLPIHSLRHTHCSYLLYRQLDIHYVSKRMGHGSMIETLTTYSHIIDEMKQQQDDLISDALLNLESAK